MCVILYVPKNTPVPHDAVRLAWAHNSHGAGITLPDAKRAHTIKGIMKLKDLQSALSQFEGLELLVHFRMATHGSIGPENTHPFKLSRDRWLMHNGILTNFGVGGIGKDSVSDSADLANTLRFVPTDGIVKILESLNGKFAVVDKEEVHLIGVKDELDGCKWSNLYFQPTTTYIHYRKGEKIESSYMLPKDWTRTGARAWDMGYDDYEDCRSATTTARTIIDPMAEDLGGLTEEEIAAYEDEGILPGIDLLDEETPQEAMMRLKREAPIDNSD